MSRVIVCEGCLAEITELRKLDNILCVSVNLDNTSCEKCGETISGETLLPSLACSRERLGLEPIAIKSGFPGAACSLLQYKGTLIKVPLVFSDPPINFITNNRKTLDALLKLTEKARVVALEVLSDGALIHVAPSEQTLIVEGGVGWVFEHSVKKLDPQKKD